MKLIRTHWEGIEIMDKISDRFVYPENFASRYYDYKESTIGRCVFDSFGMDTQAGRIAW
jgi:hypothetical protein